MNYNYLLKKFKNIINHDWIPPQSLKIEINNLLNYALNNNYKLNTNIDELFYEAINNKLELWKPYYKNILDCAFKLDIKLNYNVKLNIQNCITMMNRNKFREVLSSNKIYNDKLYNSFITIPVNEIKNSISNLINNDERYNDVLTSIFSRAVYNIFPKKCVNIYFSGLKNVNNDYLKNLDILYNPFEKNDCSLAFIEIDKNRFLKNPEEGFSYYFELIKIYYNKLMNHTDLIFIIPSFNLDGVDYQWIIYSKIVLFAEKFNLKKINNAYFRKKKIIESTFNYIKDLDLNSAQFDLVAEGFTFKDCFVLNNIKNNNYDLMIVFEKNQKDERKIICPTCFSKNIQGNSYPILNVKSWECNNVLCPDRSKYNRGKRFSYYSYMRQNAMINNQNEIPVDSVNKWHLDCLNVDNINDVFDMACRHYSLAGKKVDIISNSLKINNKTYLSRKINIVNTNIDYDKKLYSNFNDSPFFKRYEYNKPHALKYKEVKKEVYPGGYIYNGDSYEVLNHFKENSISAAITSPPYYNAKSYSQWDNIYCYLYDMKNIANEVYRVLENGGVYLFNIFDYFDNENNVALSAMGNKRMILGAYIIDLFTKIGFKLVGNIIWYKGEIQGNRSFNQGNYGPYYQAPLNCWEHIFVFSKGNANKKFNDLKSEVKNIRPYIKYIKGENILGHDAPFPLEIPELLISKLDTNDIVLDPFAGSFTTGISAYNHKIKSVSIELSETYYKLCIDRITNVLKEKD